MKKNFWTTLGLLGGAYILFSSFKKANPVLTGTVYVGQSNAPSGTNQVYSKVGTKVYDQNGNVIYTYDTANLGMTTTGSKGNMISVVIGSDFAAGIAGWVNSSDITVL